MCSPLCGYRVQADKNGSLSVTSATDIPFYCACFKCKLSHYSTDSYVMTIRWNHLVETIPNNGHNIEIG